MSASGATGKVRKKIMGIAGVDVSRKKKEYFYTKWIRPKFSKDMDVWSQDDVKGAKVGIVLQGGLAYEDNFTLETVKLYQRLFPSCPIIVSTWDNEKEEYIDKIRNSGADVVVNHFPEKIVGIQFINLQRETAMQGIKRAIEAHGCEYVAKTRTDERVYGQESFTYLMNLLSVFPVEKGGTKAEGRLISISMCSFKHRLYNVSDLFIFGKAGDVLRFFSPPFDTREHGNVLEGDDPVDYAKNRPGEIYFTTHYLESIGHSMKWTLEDSMECFRKYFIIVDTESMDLFWPKHTDMEYHFRRYREERLKEMTFRDWINIYAERQTRN